MTYILYVTLEPIVYVTQLEHIIVPKKADTKTNVKKTVRTIIRLSEDKIDNDSNIRWKNCDRPLRPMNTYNIRDTECDDFPIKGLEGLTGFIDRKMEKSIVSYLDEREWSSVTKSTAGRMVQQFGYLYDYKSRNAIQETDPLEDDILFIANALIEQGWLKGGVHKVQCIANQYFRNQGISEHIDSLQFGDTVVSISLLEDTIMTFTNDKTVNLLLPKRSIVILTEDARYNWKHSISPKVKYVAPNGQTITKSQDYRRISLTYRTVK